MAFNISPSLTYFTQYDTLGHHVAANGIISPFLMANIPLYICTTSFLSIPLSMDM